MTFPRIVAVLATLATGLAAGFFVTYTISVTRGLAVVDDATYVQAMQSINATVRTGWFAAFFFGSAPLLALAAVTVSGVAARVALAVATAIYAVGVLGVTFLVNVPLNDELAERTDPSSAALVEARAAFEDPWNEWNLLRTLAALTVFAVVVVVVATFPEARSHRRTADRG